jgi:hypothetical protein
MKFAMEAVSIDGDKRNKEGNKGKSIFFVFREMPLQIQIKRILFV